MQQLDLGKATIEPDEPVVVGSFVSLTFTYTAGHPIDDGGFAKIVLRSVGDFGTPQFDDPAAPDYCAIRTTGDCHIEPRWDTKGHTRPWVKSLFLKVTRGYLDRGKQIIVLFGDTSAGSPGWRTQTFCEDTFELKTLVDPIGTYQFKELPVSPTLSVVSGPPARAVCIAPSQVTINAGFAYHLKLEDRWGNPTAPPREMRHSGFATVGVQRVTAVDDETGLAAMSNPVDVLAEDMELHPYWADFHGQTEETCGSGTIEGYFTFARDYGLLDIAAHQGNDFEVSDQFWETVNATTARFHVPGSFVTFPGYEWSGNTPLGGDRNIYFSSEGGSIVHSCTDLLPDQRSAHDTSPTATELYRNLTRQKGPRAFSFAHVGGRYADMAMHDPEIELAVEIHSAWGTFEWLLEEALGRGYRIGICANSDDHKCHPGASYPGAGVFGSLGGLTCVLAPRLDRESILNALRARHFYATTGNRCLIDLTITTDDGRSAMMGDVIPAGPGAPRLTLRVVGTAPIESVLLRNGLETIATLRPYGEEDLGSRIKVIWSGAEVRGRARRTAWDGSLRVQGNAIRDVSPIHFSNPDQPLRTIGPDQVPWRSGTTGSFAGVILSLGEPAAGILEIDTVQRKVSCNIEAIGLEPRQWDCGGLGKRIGVYRLPDANPPSEFSFSLPLTGLHEGDNPIYIRMTQEDGHQAWTSPIYLIGQPAQ